MRRILLLILMIVPLLAVGQKAYKPIKVALKAQNFSQAKKEADKLKTDSLYRDDIDLYLLAIEAEKGINDAENLKLYLKQKYDTLAFFSSTYNLIENARKIDSLEQRQVLTAHKQPRYRKKMATLIAQYLPNLNAGGCYLFSRAKYTEAMPYLRTCIDLPQTALGDYLQMARPKVEKSRISNAVLYLTAAFQSGRYDEVYRYKDYAMQDTLYRQKMLETLALTADQQKDTLAFQKYLEQGLREYPDNPLFFARLVDLHQARAEYAQMRILAHQQLRRDSTHCIAHAAHCIALFHEMKLDSCIEAAKLWQRHDTVSVEPLYYIGASYVGRALLIQLPDNVSSKAYKLMKAQQKAFMAKAEPVLEEYRKLAPADRKRWAPLLYKVYYVLNRGKKFEEIERQL